MASETSELTFVRCPSCRSLVPASAARCRICNNPLEGGAKAEAGDTGRAPGRVRQKTITASAEELLQGTGLVGEGGQVEPTPSQGFSGAPMGDNGEHEVVDPLADFLQEFEETPPVISAPPPSQEIPLAAAANDDEDDLDSFLDEFDTFNPAAEPVEEPVREPVAPPPVQAPPEPERPQYVSASPVSQATPEADPFAMDDDPLGDFMTDADDNFDLEVAPEPVREAAPPVRRAEPEARYEPEPRREPEPPQRARPERPQNFEKPAAPPPQTPRHNPQQGNRQARPQQEERRRGDREARQGGAQASGGERREARKETPRHERQGEDSRREGQQHRSRHEERRNEREPQRSVPNRSEPQRSEAPVAGPKTGKMRPGRLFGWLVSFESPDGRSIELREGKFFITGSSIRGTDLVIEDPSISTPHALMSVSSEHGLLLQDLMSERGVFVRIGERGQYKREDGVVQLKHGEWVRFGDVEFLLTVVPGGDE